MSRALGDHALKREEAVIATPYQQHIKLSSKHKFLMIGCDGVWDVLTPQEAVDLVAGMRDASAMARKIVETSLDKGTTDNVTCMIVRLHA